MLSETGPRCLLSYPPNADQLTTYALVAAQAKVALLIGTAKYMSAHHPLPAGRNDVLALEAHLRSMDFMVISLVDLKKKEMIFYINWFCLLLNKGVYGKFSHFH